MSRFDAIFNSIKPDTAAFWDSFFRVSRVYRVARKLLTFIEGYFSCERPTPKQGFNRQNSCKEHRFPE